MFSVGEKVVYKTNAVCTVEAVETPSFVKESGKMYYKLRYIFSNGNEVVYVPVDSDVNVRAVMSKDEAEKCLGRLRTTKVLDYEYRQPALIAQHFQDILSDCSIDSSLAVLKVILLREKKCLAENKKLRQAETHYLGIVEKAVSEELSVALEKEIDEVKSLIRKAVYGE